MPGQPLPDLARVVANGLTCTQPALCRALIQGLTKGAPLPVVGFAATLNLSSPTVADALRAMPDIEYDAAGHIIAQRGPCSQRRGRYTVRSERS